MSERRFRGALVVALVGHGAGLWLLSSLQSRSVDLDDAPPSSVEVGVEVLLQRDDPDAARAPNHSAQLDASSNGERRSGKTTRSGAVVRSVGVGSPTDGTLGSSESEQRPVQTAKSVETPSADGRARALTLSELGIGFDNPFWPMGQESKDAVSLAERRLERNIAQATLEQDQAKGLGPEGPLLRALTTAAMNTAPPRSKAEILAVTDHRGQLGHIEVLSTNSDFEAWRRVVERALSALKGRKLWGRRVEMVFEVESRVALPSGRGPGVGVDVLGLPLKQAPHADSTQVKLLSPKVTLDTVEVPNPGGGSEPLELPEVEVRFNVIDVNGDPVDIGARARQIVHTRLIRHRVL